MPFFKACGHAGCPEDALEDKQYCGDHQKVHKKKWARPDRAFYHTAKWRHTAKKVKERDDYTCAICGRNEVELGGKNKLVADHIGGDYEDPFDMDKLRTLCLWCSGREDGGRRT